MINVTLINESQIYYLHTEDVICIKKGDMPRDLRNDYIVVYTTKGKIEIGNMNVKQLHGLLSSGKAETIKNKFRSIQHV